MAKRKPPSAPPIPEWVLTYGDLMSLLLCFFILLAAFSELKRPDEYKQLLEAVREVFGYSGGPGTVPLNQDQGGTAASMLERLRRAAMEPQGQATTREPAVKGQRPLASAVQEGERYVVGGSIRFEAGSWELSEEGAERLRAEIAPKIRDRRQKIEVRGHAWGMQDRAGATDPLELSYRRARAVVDFLVRECGIDPAALLAVAAGEHEPAELTRTGAGSDGENRRVQVILTEVLVDEVHPDPFWTGRTSAHP